MHTFIDSQTLLGVLDTGQTRLQLTNELQETLAAMQECNGDRLKSKAKGSVSLKLNITLENGRVLIEADVSSKRPKQPNGATMYFLTEDNLLSTQHPQQTDMFNGPREVATGTR